MATPSTQSGLEHHPVLSHDAWVAARSALLAKEKAFTRLRDELSRERRALPWERVETSYTFDGPGGTMTLADLFGPRSQLVIYHFMFPPDDEAGCKSCSFWADTFNPITIHLVHRDVSFGAVSRAPLKKLERFRQRMGWSFTWVSSAGNEFNYDYMVSFRPEQVQGGRAVYNYVPFDMELEDREGVSVFYRAPDGAIYHTYSAYARGIDLLNTAYNYLDLVPKGRDEDELDFTQSWVRYHDRYED
jgi:predicted dithiol-disulfide oxidoreductase (DUF899 family)